MDREKGQTMISKSLHRKLKIHQPNPTKARRWIHVLRKGLQFLLHYWHLSCYLCYKLVD